MPSSIAITTLWTAAWEESNVDRTCPGEHQLPGRPDVRHVITRRVDDATAAAHVADRGIQLQPGQVVGAVPPRMSADGYLVSELVTDPGELAVFADLMAPDEQLGTVPSAGRSPILLTEAELGDVIDAHHRGPGDVLFHREGLAHYDVASQNADRDAWLAGEFDPAQVLAWTRRLAEERDRGMLSQRLRILSQQLTDDERMSVSAALPVIGRAEEVRVLRHGEHEIPGIIGHDYWIARPADGPALVVRMHYSDGGAFVGAEIIPPDAHGPYLRDQERGWAIGAPFAEWLATHRELQQRVA